MATARKMIEPVEVHISPMRRRHLRAVLRIEAQVYPTPWTHGLFVSELALRSTIWATIWSADWREMGRWQFGQCGWPTEA